MSFKFIANTNTFLTAADAETLTEIDLGGVFKGQTKKSSFQLGNTGATTATFTCVVSGVESGVRDNVSYSLDNVTWSSIAVISGVAPNGVTPLITVRYTPDSNDFTTSGTFLIDVAEA